MPQYLRHTSFDEASLAPEPAAQLERWLADARAAEMIEPTAMTLATADAAGRPSARIVLFKGLHEGGLTFYTNYGSHKGRDLAANPQAALVFWWDKLERQVRVEGRVARLPHEFSRAYAQSRPRASQLSAYASRQSRPVASRAELEQRVAEAQQRFAGTDVPLPDHWGGYVLTPEHWEFWQGRADRLHDRLCYRRAGDAWVIERLEP